MYYYVFKLSIMHSVIAIETTVCMNRFAHEPDQVFVCIGMRNDVEVDVRCVKRA